MTLTSAIESSKIARKGEEAINEAIKHLSAVTQTVSYATDSIQKLGKRSEEIGGIITVITGIAEQTNLLALTQPLKQHAQEIKEKALRLLPLRYVS